MKHRPSLFAATIVLMAGLLAPAAHAQNVGIGTSQPVARLHVADSNVLFSGPLNVLSNTAANPPVEGPGARVMWYPQKAAFRAGLAFGPQWDKDSIGLISVALGNSTIAKGESAFAAGMLTSASGARSTAFGEVSEASGEVAFAAGRGNLAAGRGAVAIGAASKAIGDFSVALGNSNSATGFSSFACGQEARSSENAAIAMGIKANAAAYSSVAIGENAAALGQAAMAFGNEAVATGISSHAIGFRAQATNVWAIAIGGDTRARSFGCLSVGMLNDTSDIIQPNFSLPTDRLFQIGNGTVMGRSNAMTVLRNGNVGIGTTTPAQVLEVVGGPSASPTKLVIGNRGGFGSAAVEFVSDYGFGNQWRPGYIQSGDAGNFTGRLEFFTNGTGPGSLNGVVKGLEVRNGAVLTATGSIGSFSDARLKNSMAPFTDGLNVIEQINPITFQYNADAPFASPHTQVGIVAQELEKIAPYMVRQTAEAGVSDLRWVDSQAYIFLLINAIKEQQTQLQAAYKKMQLLEEKMNKLHPQTP